MLNDSCLCVGHEQSALAQALDAATGDAEVSALVAERCPHLFAFHPVFVSSADAARMEHLIAAIESVIALPAWQDEVLASAPAIARHDPGARGVFFGYDFHLGEDGVALIEINTNAGGALLNAALARVQQPCGAVAGGTPGAQQAERFEHEVVAMFREEWRLGGNDGPLRSVAIVDSDPENQFLYPEFLLFRKLLQRHGIDAVIADPSELRGHEGRLLHGSMPVDLVYNRLTDFMLEAPASAALRAAYLARAAVVTPHPRAHALYADKRNLAILSDPARLQALDVPAITQAVLLAGIPHTELVHESHAERLWSTRRKRFFKPAGGFGGRAAYRGDKLTRRVWGEILGGGYVAQALVPPGERTIALPHGREKLKFDLRSYCYGGKVQWNAARVYQGQTTNMRTPGGGFAAVYQV
ncbi:hypothetical protein D3872_01035 [Massilia cavernae]|uniref:Circularly permuted type 2 ATP-grasp protein n=1 Tax=Massilia cavernae TaxID=2320864 RepID=A0A418Y8C5_9BURK|nr:hypothetical protein D3872_01035 [Massilia cavernae]